MSNIIIYTKDSCPYCETAKNLLKQKNLSYQEINVTNDESKKNEAKEKSGGRSTLPQIFINGKHIGGCDDLIQLVKDGGLDKLN